MRRWFAAHGDDGWATCPVTESGFVRVSANPAVLPSPITVQAAREVLSGLRRAGAHRFVANDVSLSDHDVPHVSRHRDVTDAMLLTLARRHAMRLITFDAGILRLAGGDGVELLTA
jgi:uncharacterized protein